MEILKKQEGLFGYFLITHKDPKILSSSSLELKNLINLETHLETCLLAKGFSRGFGLGVVKS